MVKQSLVFVLILAILLYPDVVKADVMPPLYVELWLPYAAK